MHSVLAAWLSFFCSVVSPTTFVPRSSQSVTIYDVWQFPNGTWAENIAVRSNGQLLVTILSSPELYEVDPFGLETPQLLQRFPNATGLLGIVELKEDVFAVVAGNYSTATLTSTNGSYSLWKIDLRSKTTPKTSKIVDIPEASFLNGMILLDKERTVLVADTGAGVVYRVDTDSGKYQVVLNDPLMSEINGIHIRRESLYFTTSFVGVFGRVPIYSDGTAAGPVEVIAQIGFGDDFVFDHAGNAYVTQNPLNTLAKISPGGDVTVVAGNINSSILAGPTAVQFSRIPFDRSTFYVTTNGGFGSPVNGTFVEGGKVTAVRIPM